MTLTATEEHRHLTYCFRDSYQSIDIGDLCGQFLEANTPKASYLVQIDTICILVYSELTSVQSRAPCGMLPSSLILRMKS